MNTAAVELARVQLDKAHIVAPFSGIVGLRRVSVGEYITAGQPLVNLEAIDPVKADFRVPEKFLPAIRVGQTIRIKVDAFPGDSFEGKVYAIDPRLDVAGRSLLVRAVVPNGDQRLRPGLFARVTVLLQLKEDALSVPEQAIVPQGDSQFVFKIVDGKAHLEALRELLNVSQLEVHAVPGNGEPTLDIAVSKALGQKCERCWHWETDVGSAPEHPTICARCVEAVAQQLPG